MQYTHVDVVRVLDNMQDTEKAAAAMRFFKTAKGQYGEGDQFFGITVPEQRKIAQQFFGLSLSEMSELLRHPVHECRLTALIIAVNQFQKADEKQQKKIYDWYTKNTKRVNNWDLVDCSASYIVGAYLFGQKKNEWKKILLPLAASDNVWERRISMVSTHYFIRQGVYEPTVTIATKLLDDTHDLIHKACGWMLREMGKKDETPLRTFLDAHAHHMPRTMLRYAIEKMSQEERKKYLA